MQVLRKTKSLRETSRTHSHVGEREDVGPDSPKDGSPNSPTSDDMKKQISMYAIHLAFSTLMGTEMALAHLFWSTRSLTLSIGAFLARLVPVTHGKYASCLIPLIPMEMVSWAIRNCTTLRLRLRKRWHVLLKRNNNKHVEKLFLIVLFFASLKSTEARGWMNRMTLPAEWTRFWKRWTKVRLCLYLIHWNWRQNAIPYLVLNTVAFVWELFIL